jgi:predicted GNAT family acetyltransferase
MDVSDLSVTDQPDANRYEARIGGELAGVVEYVRAGNVIVLAHTEVDPAFEGRGVGGGLARGALDDVRARGGLEVVPTCPFIAAWIGRHPEYVDLVTPSMRAQFA